MRNILETVRATCAALVIALPAYSAAEAPVEPGLNEATFKGLEWRGIGPALMSGRIADIAIDPVTPSIAAPGT